MGHEGPEMTEQLGRKGEGATQEEAERKEGVNSLGEGLYMRERWGPWPCEHQ